jgi:hypothetical protein
MARKLRKNEAICSACKTIILRRRVALHPLTPECQVRVIGHEMAERGYVRAGTHGPALREAGFEVLMAPVSYIIRQPRLEVLGPNVCTYQRDDGFVIHYELCDGPWVSAPVMRATEVLTGQRISSGRRWGLVRRMLADESGELYRAIDTVRMAGGCVPKEW